MKYEIIDTRKIEITQEHFKGNGFDKGDDFKGDCYFVNENTHKAFVVYFENEQNNINFYIFNTDMQKVKIKYLSKLIALFEAHTETTFKL